MSVCQRMKLYLRVVAHVCKIERYMVVRTSRFTNELFDCSIVPYSHELSRSTFERKPIQISLMQLPCEYTHTHIHSHKGTIEWRCNKCYSCCISLNPVLLSTQALNACTIYTLWLPPDYHFDVGRIVPVSLSKPKTNYIQLCCEHIWLARSKKDK